MKFKRFKRIDSLSSQKYKPVFVQCKRNKLRSAGWFVCPYVLQVVCRISAALHSFNKANGDTSRLDRHVAIPNKKEISSAPLSLVLRRFTFLEHQGG